MSRRYDDLLRRIDQCGVAPGIGSVGQNYQMEQSPVELAHFLDACIELGVTSMLELGTGLTGGLARFCFLQLGWSVTSIDHRTPLHDSGRFILGETGDPDVLAQVKEQRFDLVFVDADHNYDSVKRDHDWYAPLATKVVALHDTAWGREGTQGVVRYWRQNAYLENVVTLDYLPPDGDGFRTWHHLKPGHFELIDPNHPIGIGYYEVGK